MGCLIFWLPFQSTWTRAYWSKWFSCPWAFWISNSLVLR